MRQQEGSRAPHRAGVVALLGRPNAGKSTLLNRWLGERLAIVTHKPQTTRSRILGILSRPGAQLLLVDTPGLHEGSRPLDELMHEAAEEASRDCDVALLLVDPARGWEPLHGAWLERLAELGTQTFVVGTKCDRPVSAQAPWPPAEAGRASEIFRISARRGDAIEELLEAVVERLPEGPAFYPEDQLTDRPLRFLVAELIREAAFEELAQELPYSLAVQVTSFDESDPGLARIDATLLVERGSQKRIVVGRGGERIKAIGIRARERVEQLLGHRAHLALWVKVEPTWAKQRKRLEALGYH